MKSHTKFAKSAKLLIGERLRRKPPKIYEHRKARLNNWIAAVSAAFILTLLSCDDDSRFSPNIII